MNMKKFLLLLAFLPGLLSAKDLIVLQSGLRFEGHIVRMSAQHLVFENEGQRYRIPASDLAFVGLDEAESMDDVDACLRAYNDTRLRGRQCYSYRAKTSATLQAAGGWATWVIFFSKR